MLLPLVLVSFLILAFREHNLVHNNDTVYSNKSRPEGGVGGLWRNNYLEGGLPQILSDNGKASEIINVDEIDKTVFECPSGLLPLDSTEPWEWNFTSSRTQARDSGNNMTSARTQPRIISFRLDREKTSAYYNRTKDSLAKYNYSLVCEVESVDGNAWAKWGNRSAITKVNMKLLGAGAEGCFHSHLSAWRLGMKHNMPIVSLESDTVAIKEWSISPDVYKDYDILFLHEHPGTRRKCKTSEINSVREGLEFWFATGAMMYTNNDPEKMERVVKEELLDGTVTSPIGHWLNKVWKEKKLRVGSLCPTFFKQIQDHESTVSYVPVCQTPEVRCVKPSYPTPKRVDCPKNSKSGAQPSSSGAWVIPAGYTYEFDQKFADAILEFLPEAGTILELGAGLGCYTHYFLKSGKFTNVVGIEVASNVNELTSGFIHQADLTEKQEFNHFDWVICLEVPEHIPKKYEEIFVDNLVKASPNGIVLTGNGHGNLQAREYVVLLMKAKGYEYDDGKSRILRSQAKFSWLMVFHKQRSSVQAPPLLRLLEPPSPIRDNQKNGQLNRQLMPERTLNLNPDGKFSFVHISKCAGASWISLLKKTLSLNVCAAEHSAWYLNNIHCKKGVDNKLVSVKSPRHHVWSQFTECKYDTWGEEITKNTKFPRSGHTPQSDLNDFNLWLEHFVPVGHEKIDAYKCYHPANFQSRFLTAKVKKNPSRISAWTSAKGEVKDFPFKPNASLAVDTLRGLDFVALTEFFHESRCLLYHRLGQGAPANATLYLNNSCQCDDQRGGDPKDIHVTHHELGHRSRLRDLPRDTLSKIEELTEIDEKVYIIALEDYMNEIAWLESKSALGKRVLCDNALKKVEPELAYLSGGRFNVTAVYYDAVKRAS